MEEMGAAGWMLTSGRRRQCLMAHRRRRKEDEAAAMVYSGGAVDRLAEAAHVASRSGGGLGLEGRRCYGMQGRWGALFMEGRGLGHRVAWVAA
ncbi:hypothetical protein E2562_033362 [Oryza meyeriana var. granulata]|uniref:Uncharacterized protein n=1 Tax=Oryza meyeriana var. granulata TaxID=110450 RepID=A0A6G1E5W4_9ORYZ|nr:hypothetical protein E2562_033362 [Oryza meyeriana var. granulata]